MKNKENKKIDDSQEEIEDETSMSDEQDSGPTLTDKLRKEPWMVSTIVLGVMVAIFLVSSLMGPTGNVITGSIVSENVAGQALLDFANSQGANAELVGVENVGEFYEVTLSLNGQEAPLMVTKDGKYYLLPDSLVPLQRTSTSTSQSQPSETYSEEDNLKIQEFSNCLSNKGMKIYGAGWCGHCKNLIKYFGGEENIAPIFIECSDAQQNPTEYTDLCNQEGISGYPTIKVNGEDYQGSRTFEGFAEATGCLVPDVEIIS